MFVRLDEVHAELPQRGARGVAERTGNLRLHGYHIRHLLLLLVVVMLLLLRLLLLLLMVVVVMMVQGLGHIHVAAAPAALKACAYHAAAAAA